MSTKRTFVFRLHVYIAVSYFVFRLHVYIVVSYFEHFYLLVSIYHSFMYRAYPRLLRAFLSIIKKNFQHFLLLSFLFQTKYCFLYRAHNKIVVSTFRTFVSIDLFCFVSLDLFCFLSIDLFCFVSLDHFQRFLH